MSANRFPPEPEFSRTVKPEDLAEGSVGIHVRAEEAELRALARRFGILEVERLEADLRVARTADGCRVAGRMTADVVQRCVVSLEPVPAHVEEEFAVLWSPATGWEDEEDGLPAVEIEEPGPHRFDFGGIVDIGEAVAQQLSLALEPYPRAPGVSADQVLGEAGLDEDRRAVSGPFAKLGELRGRRG